MSDFNKLNIEDSTVVNNKVALFVDKNIFHPEFGNLQKGYNMVTLVQANRCIALYSNARIGTPEEVSSYYNI